MVAIKGTNTDWPMQLAVFNRNLALDRVGGDEELLREVAQLFLQEYPSLMGQLEEAVAQGDAGRVMEAAHTMKGSLATLGAEAGTRIAQELETMGRHRMLSGSRETCRALAAQLSELQNELEKVAAGT
jgi:two-component system, sensor histidine kinase and response regulator